MTASIKLIFYYDVGGDAEGTEQPRSGHEPI